MSLSTSLSTAVQALNAASGAMQITNNNISNAHTTGYTREVAVLQEAGSTSENGVSIGNGVEFEGYKSVRSELLETRIEQETSAQGSADAQSTSLKAIEPTFTTSKTDIGTEMSALFSSISSLSTDPASSTEQGAVLTAGQNLATAFNTASNTLTTQKAGLNSQVSQDVGEINQLAEQIAALNPQIAQLKASGQNTGTTQDQMDALVLKLSALTNVSVTQNDNGETVSTGNGTALVVGSQSYALQTTTGSNGMQHVLDQVGNDITSSLTSGDLGGTIQTRDTIIPDILNQLDTLANQFATAINAAQATGYDQKGNAGKDFFSVSSTVSGSAASIKVAISDPALIASSSDGTSGSNGNLAKLSAVQTTALASGKTPGDAYASIVYQVGSLTSGASSESTAAAATLTQLNDQLSAVSGVSIDEESANLIMYQQAYEAAARVVSTIQEMFSVTLTMGTNAAS